MTRKIHLLFKSLFLGVAILLLIACGKDASSDCNQANSSETESSAVTQSSSSHGVSIGVVHGCIMPASCEPANGGIIELLCPAAGGTFATGDSVILGWRANQADFNGYLPQISLNGGQRFEKLANASVFAEDVNANFACVTYGVRIPNDSSWISNEVVFRVRDYNTASMRDQTSGHRIQTP